MKNFLTSILVASSFLTFAQVQIDKPIDLNGAGVNAKITGIKSVTNAQDAVSAEVLQSGSLIYALSAGASSAYTLALAPTLGGYTTGMEIRFKAHIANAAGAVTINVNGLGAKDIKKDVSNNLATGDIQIDQLVSLAYDGTNFQLISRTTDANSGGTVTNVSGTDPISVINNSTTPAISMAQANTSTNGYLSSSDWNTFSAKQSTLTFSTGLTNSSGTVTSNLSTGVSGGQTAIGGTASGNNLTLSTTSNATKGKILFGTSGYDEVNNRLGIGNASPGLALEVTGSSRVSGEMISTNVNQARFIFGNYGVIHRNDGLNNYILLTASGDQYGSFNSLRPFRIDNATGEVDLGAGALVVKHGGNVGVGISNPTSSKLEVNGQVRATGYICRTGSGGSYGGNIFNYNWAGSALQAWIDVTNVGNVINTSDRRLKENIKNAKENGVLKVMQLRPVSFNYKNIEGTIFTGSDIVQEGFIADELQDVIPSAVNGERGAVTSKGTIQPQTLNLGPVVSVLTKAIQEQQAQIEALKKENELLKAQSERSNLLEEKYNKLSASVELLQQIVKAKAEK